jgi:hypothetical protein
MKYKLTAALFLFAAQAAAQTFPSVTMPTQRPADIRADTTASERHRLKLRRELTELHDEGVKLRDADGGTLSAEHKAYLQRKLDAIRAEN